MAGDNTSYAALPFEEAIAFFRKKTNMPTERWNDLWQEQHEVAFVVAGATKADLLVDLRSAIDKAIAEGTTLATFQKDFDGIVAKHGWSYKGERGWRTRVMLETNMRTAYAAGRWEQLNHPDTLKERPFWKYAHGDSRNPRPLHLAWNGTVLRADDPWWYTHFAPNGWGCNCKVFALDKADLADLGKTGPDPAPDDGTYTWTDKATGEVKTIPNGIDPGWAYAPGRHSQASAIYAQKLSTLPAPHGAMLNQETLDAALPHLSKDFGAWADDVMSTGHQARGELRVVGGLTPKVLAHLEDVGHPPATAAIVVDDKAIQHMMRDAKKASGKTLAAEALRDLPGIIGKPTAVLWDTQDPALLYVFEVPGESRKGKLVVRVDAVTKVRGADGKREIQAVNIIRTGGLVDVSNLKDPKRYEQIEGSL